MPLERRAVMTTRIERVPDATGVLAERGRSVDLPPRSAAVTGPIVTLPSAPPDVLRKVAWTVAESSWPSQPRRPSAAAAPPPTAERGGGAKQQNHRKLQPPQTPVPLAR